MPGNPNAFPAQCKGHGQFLLALPIVSSEHFSTIPDHHNRSAAGRLRPIAALLVAHDVPASRCSSLRALGQDRRRPGDAE